MACEARQPVVLRCTIEGEHPVVNGREVHQCGPATWTARSDGPNDVRFVVLHGRAPGGVRWRNEPPTKEEIADHRIIVWLNRAPDHSNVSFMPPTGAWSNRYNRGDQWCPIYAPEDP